MAKRTSLNQTSFADNNYLYELTDHLGNVRAVVEKNGSQADAVVKTDYYPFGMPMPGRNLDEAQSKYRYKYQGQEKDSETGKEAFELRLWDARIGRWLTTDPYGEFSSPYLGMGNNPISRIDKDGGSSEDVILRGTDGHEFRFITGDDKEIYIDTGTILGASGSLDLRPLGVTDNNILGNLFFGYEANASLHVGPLVFAGIDLNYTQTMVKFLGGDYSNYFYQYETDWSKGGGDINAIVSTNADAASISIGGNFFAGYYDGPLNELNPYTFESKSLDPTITVGAAFGVSVVIDAEVYFQTAEAGPFTSIHFGANAGIGLQIAPTGSLSGSIYGGFGTTKLMAPTVIPTSKRPLSHIFINNFSAGLITY